MKATQGLGINKSACRRDTVEHVLQLNNDVLRCFGVLAGPVLGDAQALHQAGFRGQIVAFEWNAERYAAAKRVRLEKGYYNTTLMHNALLRVPQAVHTEALYDWCDGAVEALRKTKLALLANWRPNPQGGSTITVGVTTRGNTDDVHRAALTLKREHLRRDSSWVTAQYLFLGLQALVKDSFGLNMRIAAIRDYKGNSVSGENRGAHMVYVTFVTSPNLIGPRTIARVHYYNGLRMETESTRLERTFRVEKAHKAIRTMRGQNTFL